MIKKVKATKPPTGRTDPQKGNPCEKKTVMFGERGKGKKNLGWQGGKADLTEVRGKKGSRL